MEDNPSFKLQIIDLAKLQFVDPRRTKFTTEALELFTEVIRYFVEEAILRSIEACKQEESGRKGSVDVQHLRQIMGHLMLDFN